MRPQCRIRTIPGPLLVVPYMWIGDFMRGHTVVRVLKQRWPNRPIDMLATSLCAPLVDYMPGVRSGLVWDLPRSRLAVARQWELAAQLRARNYGTAIAPAPHLEIGDCPRARRNSGTGGFCRGSQDRPDQPMALGRKGPAPLHRQERCAGGAGGTPLPPEWPVPQLDVPAGEADRWRQANRLGSGPAVALAPGSVGISKRWTYYPEAARLLAERGLDVWVIGGLSERALAAEIVASGGASRPRPDRCRSAQRHFGDGGR